MGDKVGVKVAVNQGALNYIKDQLMPLAEARARAAHFDDMESDTRVRGLGRVRIEVNNLVLTNFHVSSSSIELVPPNNLLVCFNGINIEAEMRWRYKLRRLHTSDRGRGEGSTWGSSGRVMFAVGTNTQGRPTVTVSDCWVTINDFHFRVHSSASWLYNLLINLFHGQIVRSIDRAVRHAITNDFQEMIANMLAKIPLQEHVGNRYMIDYRLSHPTGIFITPDRQLVSQSPGEFFLVDKRPGQSPGLSACMPNNENGSMFQIFISAASIQSLCSAAICSGSLKRDYNGESSIVPMPFLSTGFYRNHVPGLVSKYGSDKKVSLHFEIRETPEVTISETRRVTVEAKIEMTASVQNAPDSYETAFDVVLKTTCSAIAQVAGTTISGEILDIFTKAELLHSSVGDVDTSIINEVANTFLLVWKPEYNKKLAKGAPLPSMKGVQFIDPQVHYHEGFIAVTTNINFTPSF